MRGFSWLAIASLIFLSPAFARAQAPTVPPAAAAGPNELAKEEIAAFEALLKLREAQIAKLARDAAARINSANEWWSKCVASEQCLGWLRSAPAKPAEAEAPKQ